MNVFEDNFLDFLSMLQKASQIQHRDLAPLSIFPVPKLTLSCAFISAHGSSNPPVCWSPQPWCQPWLLFLPYPICTVSANALNLTIEYAQEATSLATPAASTSSKPPSLSCGLLHSLPNGLPTLSSLWPALEVAPRVILWQSKWSHFILLLIFLQELLISLRKKKCWVLAMPLKTTRSVTFNSFVIFPAKNSWKLLGFYFVLVFVFVL